MDICTAARTTRQTGKEN